MEEFALPQGKTIGSLLKDCFEMVMENPALNDKDILIQQCNYLLFKYQNLEILKNERRITNERKYF